MVVVVKKVRKHARSCWTVLFYLKTKYPPPPPPPQIRHDTHTRVSISYRCVVFAHVCYGGKVNQMDGYAHLDERLAVPLAGGTWGDAFSRLLGVRGTT